MTFIDLVAALGMIVILALLLVVAVTDLFRD